jgi:hypothetical protein
MEHELRQYPRVELDLAALAAHAERIVLAGGRDAQDQLPYQPNRVLAQKLGRDIVNLPGGHLGFVFSPAEFAKELLDALSLGVQTRRVGADVGSRHGYPHSGGYKD